MSIADKLTTIAENEQKVYNAGYEKGKAEGKDIQVELTADEFEVGGLEGTTGTEYATTNRARTGYVNCTTAPSYRLIVSVICNSNVKWLVHFFNNGTWIGKTSFASTNCENVVNLCSSPNEVTHIKFLLAYVNNATVVDIDDLLSNFTITKSTVAKTYEDGIQEEYNGFWDNYQKNTSDGTCRFAGTGWRNETFKPKENIEFNNSYMLFRMSRIQGDLVEILNNLGVTLSTAMSTTLIYAFSYTKFSRIGVIDCSNSSNLSEVFSHSEELETVDKLIVDEGNTFSGTFTNCTALKNITIEGTIGRNIDFKFSPLTIESAKSVINALKDYSGTTSEYAYSVSFSSSTLALLEAEGNTAPHGGTWIDYVDKKGWSM